MWSLLWLMTIFVCSNPSRVYDPSNQLFGGMSSFYRHGRSPVFGRSCSINTLDLERVRARPAKNDPILDVTHHGIQAGSLELLDVLFRVYISWMDVNKCSNVF